MKKYGKYEKRPEVVPEKQPKAKSPLLQTYLTSLLCMVISVTMFFGTSFAWFTSEVTSSDNEIYIGTLDVALYKKEGKANLAGGNEKVFDSQVRWEPGYTMLETITLENNGDLAFNYELRFTDGTLTAESELEVSEVASCFDVWVYNQHKYTEMPTVQNYTQDIEDNEKWEYAGSLDELLAGKVVLSGSMDDVRHEPQTENTEDPSSETETRPVNPGTTDGKNTAHTYVLALHMKEDTTAEKVMGQKLTLNVKLIAYQKTSEPDSINATEGYDNIRAVSTLKQLVDASGNAVLTSDITVKADDAVTNVEIPGGIYLDGNGKTVSFAEDVENGTVIIACEKVYNLTVKAQVNAAANVVLSNCAFDKLVLNDNIETVTLINSKIGNNTVERAVLTVSVDENGNRTWNSDNNLVSVNNKSVSVANNSN